LSTASRSANARSPVAVGETVVYAALGVGHVVAHERKRVDGTDRDSVVVELVTGLRVTLSVAQATERLRPVADAREVEDVRRILSAEPRARTGQWTQRHRETKAKLATGRAIDLAEIIRDGEPFQGAARLSPAERSVYLQARTLLVRELCFARDVKEDEAAAWIDAQIAAAEGNGA
jgi:CarD family transcriptional regulator, regulator of rRNA transcription